VGLLEARLTRQFQAGELAGVDAGPKDATKIFLQCFGFHAVLITKRYCLEQVTSKRGGGYFVPDILNLGTITK
jgi:hypothetical protein